MSDEIGELIEKKMSVEWRVPNFFSLPQVVDEKLVSPIFFFVGLAWVFWLYPKGELQRRSGKVFRPSSEKNVNLYLCRRSSGPPKTVTFSLGLRKANGEEEEMLPKNSQSFPSTNPLDRRWGQKKLILSRSDLLNRKNELAPEDTLTVTCTLSVEDGNSSDDSFTTRLWNLSLDLATVMSSQKDADVTLELSDGKLNAHKMILKSRSPVFGSMFSHDMKECQTGEVKIEDADKKSFEIVLAYTYTGHPHGLSTENAKDVYKLSHKYNLRDLTKCCREFLRAGLSVETIFDVITIADLYQDKKLMDSAKDYFVRRKVEIRKTDQWKALKEANVQIAFEMLEYTLDNT